MEIIKKCIAVSIFFISGHIIQAQRFSYGISGGIDVTYLLNTEYSHIVNNFDRLVPMQSFNFNGYIGYRISGSWSISVEPGYIQKGCFVTNDGYKNLIIRSQLHYLQLPVMANYQLSRKFYISWGLEIAYLVSAIYKTTTEKTNHTDLFRPVELSGLIGINYRLSNSFDIGLRISQGLISATKKIELVYPDTAERRYRDLKFYNQYIQLSIRFRI